MAQTANQQKNEELLIKSMLPMMKSMFELFAPDLMKAKPESEAVRAQANILAVYIYGSPMGVLFRDMMTINDFAKIMYNLKQSDFNKLYEKVEQMKKEVR